ncbi:hypothetical protein RvY_14614 [Ramazzottius varieornatus]|uniref:Cytochrome b-c1 complex subunit 7 n=1 Tax=Ramazzottius varieornatus TaxID=947166 RepID=A0A1D1VVP4_RAMVA|nr:hypothetical protein RvY_14614 [Ramazzottius varieornatus]
MSTNIMIPNKTAVQKLWDNIRIVKNAYDSWKFKSAGYREYGLYHSDLYNDDNAVVAEAVRRLPEHVYEARVHRMHRAMQLSRNKIILPESMWPKEDEPMQHYLEPYIKEVQKELAERAEWDKR